MSKTVTEFFKEATDLEERDRALLAGLLLESLEIDPDPEVETAWEAEVEKRLQDLKNGNVECIPWEEVKRKLESKISPNH